MTPALLLILLLLLAIAIVWLFIRIENLHAKQQAVLIYLNGDHTSTPVVRGLHEWVKDSSFAQGTGPGGPPDSNKPGGPPPPF